MFIKNLIREFGSFSINVVQQPRPFVEDWEGGFFCRKMINTSSLEYFKSIRDFRLYFNLIF
ncbi:hypothetical protein GCM10017717_25740 [Deinococcus persicinus]